MSEQDIPEHFVDLISNVKHANGVYRITLSQQDDETTARPVTRIMVPANQLPRLIQGLTNAASQIEQKVREKIAEGQDNDENSAAKPVKKEKAAAKKK